MSYRHIYTLVFVAIVSLLPWLRGADMPDPLVTEAEKVLKDARITIDGPSLLKFFRERTLSDVDKTKLAEKIRQLGDDSFEVRERASEALSRAGRLAVPFLKEALKDPDLEVSRRAERCLEEISSNPDLALAPAAARMLAIKKPEGTLETLLAYLPWSDDESIEMAVFDALAQAGIKEGKADALLVKALGDKHPLVRIAAIHVLAKAEAAQAKLVTKLLTDTDARVRYQAASAQVRAGNKDAIAVLTALLADGPFAIACQAEEILFHIAGDKSPSTSLTMEIEARRKVKGVWDDWWKTNGGKIDLAKIKLDETLLGINAAANCDYKGKQGRVWGFDNTGKVRWQFDTDMNCPSDVQALPGGRVLIAEYSGSRVTERDRDGKILWSHKVTTTCVTCQRLPNGNTFISTYNELLEVTPKGTVVYSHATRGGWGQIFRAVKQRNGHIVFICSGNKVIELDATGKELRQVPTPGAVSPWASVELLPNGHFLVGLYGANKVAEIDATGKVQMEISVKTPSSASRLPNGHTLVSSMDAQLVIEYDRAGKEVWKQATEGRPFRVRRY